MLPLDRMGKEAVRSRIIAVFQFFVLTLWIVSVCPALYFEIIRHDIFYRNSITTMFCPYQSRPSLSAVHSNAI